MPLLPPRVVGPLSECSGRVRVQGQLTGSTVKVFAGANVVAQGVASWSDQTFALTTPLAPGDMVTATQTVGVETSINSPEAVEVQAKPPAVGPVAFVSNLNECGECVYLEGLVPGAKVEVRNGAGPVLGSGESYDGVARVGLSPQLTGGMNVRAQQNACGMAGVDTAGPPVEGTRERKLNAPTVQSPLRECQRTVTVSDVVHGATVTLMRSGGPNLQACFDLGSLYFTVNPPLALGETVTAQQAFPKCGPKSPDATPVVVQDNTPVPPANVKPPLCKGSTTVTVTGLIQGARVRIRENGVDIGEAESPVDGEYGFLVPPLGAGSVISAIQELCGEWSGPGTAVTVDPAPVSLPKPKVADPLFECSAVVRVLNLMPGTRVYVYSAMLNGPIGEKQVFAAEEDVSVAPLLIKGDKIHAIQKGCGLVSSKSASVEVKAAEELRPPTVASPLYSCDTVVRVVDVTPGARVDVYVNGVFRGTEKTGTTTALVPISGSLQVGDQVTARQRLCDFISKPSKPVRVEEFCGRWRRVGGDNAAEILAVHAALLRTGKIVYFGGDQHTSSLNVSGDVDHTRVYDCKTGAITTVTGLPGNADLFCAGHALLEDGRLLAAGGTRNWGGGGIHPPGHFIGLRDAYIFDPATETWSATGKLVTQRPEEVAEGTNIERTGGKWYPTLVVLPDGRVLALSGHPEVEDSRHNNNSLELYSPATGVWTIVPPSDYDNIDSDPARRYEYPRLHVLPDRSVISTSVMADGTLEKWHPYDDATNWEFVANPAPSAMYQNAFAQDTTSVLLPLKPTDKYRARVLVAGDSMPFVLDTTNPAAGWTAVPRNMVDYPAVGDVNPRRENLDAVILPTGEVFIEGGVKNFNDDNTAVKRGEMFNPETNTWKVLPEAERARQYHSTALLMPDGAVWVAGSNFNSGTGLANRELRIEVFEPWYFCGRRPVLTDASKQVSVGQSFDIRTPDAASIRRVVIVRCGSVTHNFNSDQRHIELVFKHDGGEILMATVPSNPAVAIPGYYLVFVIDGTGRPSEGKFIQVRRARRRFFADFHAGFVNTVLQRMAGGSSPTEDEVRTLRSIFEKPAPGRRRLPPTDTPTHGEHVDPSDPAHGPGGHGGGGHGGGHDH
ncbi:MAG: DUF1929 domain-containing protein [Acidobacteria bacterium]|nr:DUF1929 domain-containing protein [Acidobacteriota bacterium]